MAPTTARNGRKTPKAAVSSFPFNAVMNTNTQVMAMDVNNPQLVSPSVAKGAVCSRRITPSTVLITMASIDERPSFSQ